MLKKIMLFAVCAFCVQVSSAVAESVREARFGVGMGVSTLGLTGDVSYHLNPHLGVRALGGFGQMSRSRQVEGVNFSGSMRTGAVGPVVDIYPFANGWRTSAGAMLPLHRMSLSATGGVNIGSNRYEDVDIQASLSARSSLMPKFSVGYDGGLSSRVRNGRGFDRVGLTFDLGVMRTTGFETRLEDRTGRVSQSDLNRLTDDVNRRLDRRDWIPYVRLGLRANF